MSTGTSLRNRIRGGALAALKACGAYDWVSASNWRQQRLLILCYHCISLEDEHLWRPLLFLTPQLLDQRLQILREGNYSVLPLGEGIDRLYSGSLPPRSVVITFDDGTYDFYKLAYPLLQKYRFPATVYLTTYYSALQTPVFHLICSYMLWKARDAGVVELSDFGVQGPVNLASAQSRDAAMAQIVQWTDRQNLTGVQKDAIAEKLAVRLGIDYALLRSKRILQLMNSNEVRELAAQGVDFQLHTHRHRTPVDPLLFGREIRDNRAHIAGLIGGERNHFCYPSGAYRPEFLEWLSNEKVASATTCDTNFATRESHPLLLPRLVDTSARTTQEFESWLAGVGHFLSRRRRARLAYVED